MRKYIEIREADYIEFAIANISNFYAVKIYRPEQSEANIYSERVSKLAL